MAQDALHAILVGGEDLWQSIVAFDWGAIFVNKFARAAGLLALVWATIWTIALVYNGYAQDSERAVGIRIHPNRKLGEGDILFDQSIYPFTMDGVEAVGQIFYVYESGDKREKKPRRIAVTGKLHLKLHIRVSPIPKDANTHFGFESPLPLRALDSVTYPAPEMAQAPDAIQTTPPTVGEYITQRDLEASWKDDDDVPIISLGATQLELLAGERLEHIQDRARAWEAAQKPGFLAGMGRDRAVRERANVFGSYYIKLQFSKRPDFVLFKHPNKELKMTAWLTVLTSVFSIAMDLWPVDHESRANPRRGTPAIERPVRPMQAASLTSAPTTSPPPVSPAR